MEKQLSYNTVVEFCLVKTINSKIVAKHRKLVVDNSIAIDQSDRRSSSLLTVSSNRDFSCQLTLVA